jgi:bifunctional DNA-binding transcriptional regulator/antitoxin component of YhaV-PrlF toxin-antitoxin module
MEKYIHKINGIIGKTSLSVILPKNILTDLAIAKGNFVEIKKERDEIIIKKIIDTETSIKNNQLSEDKPSDLNFTSHHEYNIEKSFSNMLPVEEPRKLSTGISQ